MKRLLIAYDGSPCAEAALEDLAQAGLGDELEAVVVSVADVWLPVNAPGQEAQLPAPYAEAVRKAREQARQAVRSAEASAEAAAAKVRGFFSKWRVTAHACADSPAWGIL